MRLVMTNTEIVIYPDPSELDRLAEVKEATTYMVEGANFSQEYMMGFWDGRISLLRKLGKSGRWASPIGLLNELLDEFPGAEVEDKRRRPSDALELTLDPKVIPSLRPYQQTAKDAITQECGLETGKGLLRLPTRSGKTVIAGATIADLGHRALFVVNSEMLLDQTIRFFRRAIKLTGARHVPDEMPLVGQWGSGELDPGWITVASVQSITTHLANEASCPKRKGVEKLLRDSDVVFFDECHHLEADLWRKAMTQADAMYKIGLSATIYLDRDGGTPKASIWLLGATGPVIYSLTPSDLIRQGWLCKPVITFHSAPDPGFDVEGSWQAVYRDGIVENEPRNQLIADIASCEVELGARTLITVKQIKHCKLIAKQLERAGLRSATVTGKTNMTKRNELVKKLQDRELDVLLGTVFGEAVDMPFLDTVIIADGLSSKILTMQRLRNLTPVDENDRPRLTPMSPADTVRVHDFVDTAHKTLKRHTKDRLRTYSSNKAFKVRWSKGGDGE